MIPIENRDRFHLEGCVRSTRSWTRDGSPLALLARCYEAQPARARKPARPARPAYVEVLLTLPGRFSTNDPAELRSMALLVEEAARWLEGQRHATQPPAPRQGELAFAATATPEALGA